SDLAERVLVSRPTTTRVVDRLVRRGWIERHRDGADRRVVRVQLTAAGSGALRRAARVHLDGIARLVEQRLSPDQVEAMGDALQLLAEPDPEPGEAGVGRD
ncbi:MAG: MarR family winged helix-turn-helix transcriptional regulator, partial [Microthrixaceae bacterium]